MLNAEAVITDCEITGTLPSELAGAFVRVGGQWFYPPAFADDAPLNADGYVSAFRLGGGRAAYTGRWIRTPRFEANLAAGRQLYGYYRNAYTDDVLVRNVEEPQLRTVANTAPLAYGGKLFALKEDGLPVRLDPHTLDTLGLWHPGPAYTSATFTAHPKVDPLTGEMIAYGYEATGAASDDLFLYTLDRAGAVTSERKLRVPYVSMVHDIALTQRHIVIPFGGFVTSLERLREGRIHWGWDPAKPSYVGIVPRDGDAADVRWFRGPERCMMHTLNAWDDGEGVVLDAPFWDGNFFPFFPNVDASPWNPAAARARLRRLRFDLGTSNDGWTEEILSPLDVDDRGRVDHRLLSLPTRFSFMAFTDHERPFHEALRNVRPMPRNAYGRFDAATRTMRAWHAEPHVGLQECSFIPRSPTCDEGDGYLAGVADDHLEQRSELLILDALQPEAGPIARVRLPMQAGPHIHGVWVPDTDIDTTL